MDNNYMDNLVRNAIGDFETSYEDQDWEQMSAQLDEHYEMRRKVLTVKGVELCLMILTIWTVFQFVQTDTISNSAVQETIMVEVPNNEHPQQSVMPISTEETKQEGVDVPQELNEEPEKAQLPANVPFAGLQDDVKLLYESNENTIVPIANSTTKPTNYLINQNKSPIDLNLHESIFINDKQSVERASTQSVIPALAQVYHRTPLKDMDRLEAYELKPLEIEPIILEKDKPAKFRLRLKQPPKDKPYRYGAFASSELNAINTPDIVAASKQPQNFSYSGGLGVNFELSPNWELETGISATSFTYTERGHNNFGKTNATILELKDVELDMIDIPVNVQYNVSKLASEKLRVYALAGVTNRFVTAIRNVPKEFAITGPIDNLPDLGDEGIKDLQDEGIFEGGGFNKNHYITANLGFGVERVISKKWSLFIQPTYKQALSRVGRHDDAISSFSLMAGTRASL